MLFSRSGCVFACLRTKDRHIFKMFSAILRQKTTRIRLYPPLPEETVEKMESLVALNISFNKITWVQEDKTRQLIDWGRNQFFEKPPFSYNHLLYQDKLLEAINDLPDSDVYLIASSSRQTKSLSKVKYLVYYAVIEAMVITLINATKGKVLEKTKRIMDSEDEDTHHLFQRLREETHRKPVSYPKDVAESETNTDVITKSEFVYKITNKVYIFHNRNFLQVTPAQARGERVSSYPFVAKLIKEGTGPLAGLEIPAHFHPEILKLNDLQDKEGLARCLLMADSVVKFCSDLELEEEEEVGNVTDDFDIDDKRIS